MDFQQLLQQHSSQKIIESLQAYISPRRQERILSVVAGRMNSIQLAIEAPSDINNALATLRSCEALGISAVHFIQAEKNAANLRSITQGAFYWIRSYYHPNLNTFLDAIKAEGFVLAGGAVHASSTIPLHAVPIEKPLCLLLGNERHGLSPEALSACDLHYQIPMAGMSESLNLSVSAAISVYDTTLRKRIALGKKSDLTLKQQLESQAQYYIASLNPRLVNALLMQHPTKQDHC